jgi:hypothetical protein
MTPELRRLSSCAARERRARLELERAIIAARESGASWRAIASAASRSVEGVRKIARARV